MSNKSRALSLLYQMIETSEAVDARANNTNNLDPSKPRGEGYFTFHLKQLKELVEEISDDNSTSSSA